MTATSSRLPPFGTSSGFCRSCPFGSLPALVSPMMPSSLVPVRRLAGLLPLLLYTACQPSPASPGPEKPRAATEADGAAAARPIADADAAEWQKQLLDLAMESASKLPLDPHIKNRARFQSQVVLRLPRARPSGAAMLFAKQIPNWRRGDGLADVALYAMRKKARADGLPRSSRGRRRSRSRCRSRTQGPGLAQRPDPRQGRACPAHARRER